MLWEVQETLGDFGWRGRPKEAAGDLPSHALGGLGDLRWLWEAWEALGGLGDPRRHWEAWEGPAKAAV